MGGAVSVAGGGGGGATGKDDAINAVYMLCVVSGVVVLTSLGDDFGDAIDVGDTE